MSDIDEKLLARLQRLEREVERLRVKERPDSGSGVTDHGALTGLADNDHPQYRLVADAIDHGALGGLSDNDHPQYLLTTGKAADADKLDGNHASAFATAGHNHDTAYLGVTAKAADADKLDGLDSTAFGRPVFLTTPKTSTSWDGDARSTTSATKIDTSTVFGIPDGVKRLS